MSDTTPAYDELIHAFGAAIGRNDYASARAAVEAIIDNGFGDAEAWGKVLGALIKEDLSRKLPTVSRHESEM